MIDVKLDIDLRRALRGLNDLRRVDTRKAFRELRGPASFDQRDHDNREMGPDGRWPPLAASTKARMARMAMRKKRRRAVQHKLLGRLPKALVPIVTQRSLIMRSRVKWSMAHQAGAVVGRGARLPRRQFLWISPWLREQARKEFERMMRIAWERAG